GNLTSRVDSGFGRFAPMMCNVAETTTGTNGKRFVPIVAVRPLRRRRGVNSLGNRLSLLLPVFRWAQRDPHNKLYLQNLAAKRLSPAPVNPLFSKKMFFSALRQS